MTLTLDGLSLTFCRNFPIVHLDDLCIPKSFNCTANVLGYCFNIYCSSLFDICFNSLLQQITYKTHVGLGFPFFSPNARLGDCFKFGNFKSLRLCHREHLKPLTLLIYLSLESTGHVLLRQLQPAPLLTLTSQFVLKMTISRTENSGYKQWL